MNSHSLFLSVHVRGGVRGGRVRGGVRVGRVCGGRVCGGVCACPLNAFLDSSRILEVNIFSHLLRFRFSLIFPRLD